MNFPEDARVWIYQSNRFLKEEEETQIQKQLNDFTSQWQAHGNQLVAIGEIRYHLFIILFVDEQQVAPTGCSIDRSINLIKSFEQQFNLNFLDRFQIAYRDPDMNIRMCNRTRFAELLDSGVITKDIVVFNNLITNKKSLQTDWEVPFEKSWHARVFAV